MLTKHAAIYVVNRGLPGLINFLAIAVYTRFLTQDEFGQYTLAITVLTLSNALFFEWLSQVIARFTANKSESPREFLAEVLYLYLAASTLAITIGTAVAVFWADPVWQKILAVVIPLLVSHAFFEVNLTLASAKTELAQYGKLLIGKSSSALVIGTLLAWLGWGAYAPLSALIFGQVAMSLLFGLSTWKKIRPKMPSRTEVRRYLAYGLPLSATFALGAVVTGTDRVMIAHLIGQGQAGVYAVGFDLAQHSLGMLLMIINSAAFPLAIRAMESGGIKSAQLQVLENCEIFTFTAFAATGAMIALTPEIISFAIGAEFREGAMQIFPWIAVSALIGGIKSSHFDIAFHLSQKSQYLLAITAAAALTNMLLNFVLIPLFGIMGAAWSSIGAYVLAIAGSITLGRRVFPMPPSLSLLFKGALVGAATWYVTSTAPTLLPAIPPLLSGTFFGAICIVLTAYILNTAKLRTHAHRMLFRH